ncbi:MAG: hypothetical protein JKY67_00075 [Pseudomonadales bacterium]|nr:hypothetical protein [Pseudomonadales bacterium]
MAIKQAYDDSATKMKKEIAAHNADIRPERMDMARFMFNKERHGKHSHKQILT